MTKTDAWRRLAVETPEGATLLFDPSEVFYLEVDPHDTLLRTTNRGFLSAPCPSGRGWRRSRLCLRA